MYTHNLTLFLLFTFVTIRMKFTYASNMDIICRLCAIKGYLVTMICLFVVIINLPILEDEKFAIIAPHDCLPHALDILQNSVVERKVH